MILACVVAALFAWQNGRAAYKAHQSFVVDDAYITLRYARHLADGAGAVWNAGERVEGYTSLLAVVLIAWLHRLGLDLVDGALLLNLAGFVLLVGAVFCYGFRISRGMARAPVVLVPTLIVVSYPPLYVWIHGRLEGPLFAGLVAVALLATTMLLEQPERRSRQAAAALTLGILTLVRPDGGFFGLAGALFVFAACARRGWMGARDYVRFALLALGVPAALTAFRLFYYGEWLPNTVYAKATGLPTAHLLDTGLAYAAEFATARPYLPFVALLLTLFALVRRERWWPVGFLAVSAVGYCAVVVMAGGDHMAAHRLLLPLVAPLAMLCAEGLAGFTSRADRAELRAAAASLAGALLLVVVPAARYYRAEVPDPAAYIGTIVGEHLRANYQPGTLVALHTAGSTPYFAPDLRFIDMLGLNDSHIAHRQIDRLELYAQRWPGHAKGDGNYVLERQPDVIILGPAEGTNPDEPFLLSDIELGQSSRFAAEYVLREHFIDVTSKPDHAIVRATRRGWLRLQLYERKAADDR